MKKIYESPFNSWDESAEALIIYALDEGDYDKLFDEYEDEFGYWDSERLLEDMGYYSEWGSVLPGARYTRYWIEKMNTHFLIITRYDALNV